MEQVDAKQYNSEVQVWWEKETAVFSGMVHQTNS